MKDIHKGVVQIPFIIVEVYGIAKFEKPLSEYLSAEAFAK